MRNGVTTQTRTRHPRESGDPGVQYLSQSGCFNDIAFWIPSYAGMTARVEPEQLRNGMNWSDWFLTPAGQYDLKWCKQQCDKSLDNYFGYHALQLGCLELDALAVSRIPSRWRVEDCKTTHVHDLVCAFDALGFAEQSIDLVVMPHTLERAANPHATLREVHRVLVPEGYVVLMGFQPFSLWGLGHRWSSFWSRRKRTLPAHQSLAYGRVRDWLNLLDFEIVAGRMGCYRPQLKSLRWFEKLAWMELAGDRWWPVFGATYFLIAKKKISGLRLIDPTLSWEKNALPARDSAAGVAGKTTAKVRCPK